MEVWAWAGGLVGYLGHAPKLVLLYSCHLALVSLPLSLPGHPVNLACKMMASASSKVEGLAEVTALVYNGTNGTLTCLDPDTEYIECADPTGCGLGPDSLAWDYQVLGCISCLSTVLISLYNLSLESNV